MGQVSATNTVVIHAPADEVARAIADYGQVRPAILPDNYTAYRVIEGGQGNGTVVAWNLRATKSRNRDVEATVSVNGDTNTHWELVEVDAHSTLVTSYVVRKTTEGSLVEVTTTWKGGSGVKGMFEGFFAPMGMRRIQEQTLHNLRDRLEA